MTKTQALSQGQKLPPQRKRFRLMLAALGASEAGATALGYALVLAAAVMFTTAVTGGSKPQQKAAVTHGDKGDQP